jgi:hypothetical protein
MTRLRSMTNRRRSTMAAVGSLQWSERRGGVLTRRERWSLVLAGIAARLQRARQSPTAKASGLEHLDPQALRHIDPPDDALATAALRAAEAAQEPWLTQHAWRTYAWGSLLGHCDGLRPDRSVFFAAALLHDLGLSAAHAEPRGQCFAVRGARAARQLMRDAGASTAQADRVAEAISLHLNLRMPADASPEARLVQAGASLDVLGRRYRELAPPLREAVLQRHPRMEMKTALCRCLQHQADAAPGTRMGLYVRRFGFTRLVAQAPFSE